MNEFKDHAIANVAIQGHVRLDHSDGRRCCMPRTLPGSHLYVGLVATPKIKPGSVLSVYTHRLERFSSMMISNRTFDPMFMVDDDIAKRPFLCVAWKLGVVTDSNQSPNMLRIHVDVQPIRYVHKPNEIFSNTTTSTEFQHTLLSDRFSANGKPLLLLSRTLLATGVQLLLRWFDPNNKHFISDVYDSVTTAEAGGNFESFNRRAEMLHYTFDPRYDLEAYNVAMELVKKKTGRSSSANDQDDEGGSRKLQKQQRSQR